MKSKRLACPRIRLAVLALCSVIAAAAPVASAATYSETFEDDTSFFQPTSTWYTMQDTIGYTDPAIGHPGKSFQSQSGSSGFNIGQSGSPPLCRGGTGPSGPAAMEFDFMFSSLPTNTVTIGFAGTYGKSGLAIHTDGSVGFEIDGYLGTSPSTGTFNVEQIPSFPGAGVISINTWYHGTVSLKESNSLTDGGNVRCSSGTVHTVTIQGTGYGPYGGTMAQSSNLLLNDVDNFRAVESQFTTNGCNGAVANLCPSSSRVHLDNLVFTTSGVVPQPGVRFCSNLAESPNYGYTYRSGAVKFEGGGFATDISMEDGIKFSGDSGYGSWDWLAKQFTTGSKAMHVNFQIESQVDGLSSVFRANLMTVSGATPDGTSRGNGLNTGNFANHAEAQFVESGNHWQITLWYVTAGGTRTQVGAAVNHGSPNNPTTYVFWLDNRGTTPYMRVSTFDGTTLITSNSTAQTPAFQTAFSEDTIFDQWFVGYGDTALFDAATALNNNEAGSENSTCIYDDVGTSIAEGSSGTIPQSTVPSATSTSTGPAGFLGLDPAGFDPSGNNNAVSGGFFMSLLLILGFAVIGAGIIPGEKPSTMIWGAGIGVLLGFAWTVFLGIMPPIITFLMIVVGVGIIGVRFFAQGRASGGG